MPAKGVGTLVWDMFENSGSPQYYLLYAAVLANRKSRREREREEIEKLTR